MVEPWLAWTRQGNDPEASKLFTWDLTPATVVGGPPGHGPHPPAPGTPCWHRWAVGLHVSTCVPPAFGLTTFDPLAHSHGL